MSQAERCPEIEDLLSVVDGDASPEMSQVVVRHVEACARCREQLRTINETIAIGREYVALSEPAEVARAVRFRRRLQEERQEELRQGDRWRRVGMTAAVMMAAIAGLLLLQPSTGEVVSVEDLLARAVAFEQPALETKQRIRLTVTPAAAALTAPGPRIAPAWLVREVDVDGGQMDEGADENLASVTGELQRAGIDVHRPLSAAAFGAWRASVQGSRRDRVTVTGDLLVLKTVAWTGPIRFAELSVTRTGYRVVGQAWVIEGVGRVEIQAVAQPDAHIATAAARSIDGGRARPLCAVDSAARDALEHLELDARLVVSGVDPDGQIEIARRGSRVLVTGAVTSAAKRRALAARLTSRPDIVVKLRAAPASARGGELDRWAERTFGQGRARHTFAASLRRMAVTVDRRIAGLDALARRYPVHAERGLSPAARGKLQTLVAREYRALTGNLLVLDARLMVLGMSAGRAGLPPRKGVPADWRERMIAAAPSAAVVHAAVEELLASDDLPEGPVAADAAFAGVWSLVVGQR